MLGLGLGINKHSYVNSGVDSPLIVPDCQLWLDGQDTEYINAKGAASLLAVNSEYLSNSNSVFHVADNDFSFFGWFKTPSSTTQYLLGRWNGSGDNRSYVVRINGGVIDVILNNDGTGGGNTILTTTFAPGINTWNFIAVTYNSTTDVISASMNGAAFQTAIHAGGCYNTDANLAFGVINLSSSPLYANAFFDQWGFIKGTVLNYNDVLALYNSGNGVDYAGAVAAVGNIFTAYWEMDDPSGNRKDATGNGYDLTDNNTVGFTLGKVTSGVDVDDAVWRWVDKSPNAYVWQQDTAAAQPIYTANAINSKFGLVFDGVDDFLQYTGGAWRASDNVGTFIWCSGYNGNTQVPFSASQAGANNYLQFFILSDKPGVVHRDAVGGLNRIEGNSILSIGEKFIYVAQSNGSLWSLRLNGVQQTITPVFGSNTGQWLNDVSGYDTLRIGGMDFSTVSYYANVDAEIIYYPTVLSASDISQVESYLSNKYGISI